MQPALQSTVIVPLHTYGTDLEECLAAIRLSMPAAELLLGADGVGDNEALRTRYDARIVVIPGPSGPAVARNRAAEHATGDVLVFVDSDVVVTPTTLPRMMAFLADNPNVAAVFGAYDRDPAAANFTSQFKNLLHAYVHETAPARASTFWAGLGAVRRAWFRRVGGFDERFGTPSVEDVDFGMRLVAAGAEVRLVPSFTGRHLKRWSFWSCVMTDIRARGIPWTQLIHRRGTFTNDLNTTRILRASVGAAWLTIAAIAATPVAGRALAVAIAALACLVALNRDAYRWLARRRGVVFAVRAVPLHVVHHLCNGLSFVIGTCLFKAARRGLALPGSLPIVAWPSTITAAASVPPQAPSRLGSTTEP